MDELLTTTVHVSDPGEIAAGLPALIGFVPQESVVLLGLGGASGNRIGMTARVDLPPPAEEESLARVLVERLVATSPAGAVVAVFSDDDDIPELPGGLSPEERLRPDSMGRGLPHRSVVTALDWELAEHGIELRESMLVRAGRWWSYPHVEPGAPGPGRRLPAVSAVAAAAVVEGVVIAPDRAAIGARIARLEGMAAHAMKQTTWRVVDRRAGARDRDPVGEARRNWQALLLALERCRPGSRRPLNNREAAEVLWALADVRVRDRAMGFALSEDADAAQLLWTECTRRAPRPLDAAPATLLAVSAWVRGDGAMANIALERALHSRPTYSLAQLLAQLLEHGAPPSVIREMITDTRDDLADDEWVQGFGEEFGGEFDEAAAAG